MKRLTILILLSVLFPLSLLSQSYTIEGYPTIEPWISESYLDNSPKFWYSHLKMEDGETFINLCYNIMGDSILNDKVYSKVGVGYDKKEDLLENMPMFMIALHPYKKGKYSDILLFRQEGDKVFYWDKINQKDLLILNYGLNEGDTFINAVGDEYIVSEVSGINKSQYGIQNWYTTAQKMLRLVAKDSRQEDVWVEGIGSLNWGILPLFLASQVAPLSSETLQPQKAQVALSSGSNYMGQFYINEPYYKFMPFEIDNYGNETETENYKDLTYWFEGDTLCIKGYMNLNCYNTYAECLIKDQVIDIMIKQAYLLDELDCLHEAFVNVRIPGFEPGLYNVGIVGRNYVTIECKGAQEEHNYTPFVAKWKQWHVLGFNEGPAIPYDYEFKQSGNVIDGKTYYPLYLNTGKGTNWEKLLRFYLFREEDRRVYLYDYETAQEHCVYDFTLEEGDTFDIGWGDEADRCVVTKVDYIDVKGSKLKTITFSSVNPAVGCLPEHKDHTWVEGIGDLSQPIAGWKPNSYERAWSYQVAYMFMPEYNPDFYPFSFCGASNDNYWVIGQELVRGETIGREKEWEYEIIDGKLHVKGCWYLHPNPNSADYIYCIISPTEDNKTYTISTEIESMDRVETCEDALYEFDLCFDIPLLKFDDNYNFVVVDENGVEHPVPNRDKYHPFIEEGKVWKTGQISRLSTLANEVRYYYFDGDSIVGGQSCKKMMQCTENTEMRKTELVALLYEQEKRVYNWNDNRGFACLYDFAADIDEEIVFNNPIFWGIYQFIVCKIIAKEHQETAEYTGNVIQLEVDPIIDVGAKEDRGLCTSNGTTTITWLTGVGGLSNPLRSIYSIFFNEESDEGEWLISCYTAIDTLFQSSKYTDAVSEYWDEDNETKKQKIDFTHVIKTKPTSPRVAANISLVEGEYDNAVLCIDFEGMNGRYKINVRKDGEQQDRFSANQETHNLQSLDVNLAGYPDGDYTVVVENDGESFTAHFALPLDGTGIESIQNSKFTIHNGADAIYDLSGRRVVNPKRGLYIQGGRKVLIE